MDEQVVEMCFLRLRRCKMQATSSTTAVINSMEAIETPMANFRIEMQNSCSETIFFGGNRSAEIERRKTKD